MAFVYKNLARSSQVMGMAQKVLLGRNQQGMARHNLARFLGSKTDLNSADVTAVHFRRSATAHPLVGSKDAQKKYDEDMGNHTGRQQNHIWTDEELTEKMSKLYHHVPKNLGDHAVHKLMYGLYHTFNFVSGYKADNPTVKAIEWRLIVLESIAGVPGFVAAGLRHFRSLRTLRRDHGWIATLLEEAENERMHLLLCLNMFQANFVTRVIVIAAQMVMVPLLFTTYVIHPPAMHRFVGYLEETACKTYINVIHHVETPGTHLHAEWAKLDAPPMAKGYYKLPSNGKWVDTLKCMMADETHHRDVNHTFADMKSDDPNPFLEMHKENAIHAWRMEITGEPAWPASIIPAKGAAGEAMKKINL